MTVEVLLQLLLGALLGAAGQMLRVLVGFKKLFDQADQTQQTFKDLFIPARLVVSLIIGAVAGMLGMISVTSFHPDFLSTNTKQILLSLLGAGYAGTDFIEGFIRKFLPGGESGAPGNGDQTSPSTTGGPPQPDPYQAIVPTPFIPIFSVPAPGPTAHL